MIYSTESNFSFKLIRRLFGQDWFSNSRFKAEDKRHPLMCKYEAKEAFLSCVLMFLLRHRSLRSFTKELRYNESVRNNFSKSAFESFSIPSDDQTRRIMSHFSVSTFNKILVFFHKKLERKKLIQEIRLLGKYDLGSIDGTGQISSYKVSCSSCLKRKVNKEDLYMHGQLLCSLTSVDNSISLPLLYEPIDKSGDREFYQKNDCELNAAKRLLNELNRSYPKRPFCILADALFSVSPIVKLIENKGWVYIITAKAERNKELFSWYDCVHEKKRALKKVDDQENTYEYSWSNGLPIKHEDNPKKHHLVNLLEVCITNTDGEIEYYNTWVTNIKIDEDNVEELTKGGRSRFNIENKSFNELKNNGFHMEHNFGHFGNLPNVFFGCMLIAHLFSQCVYLSELGKKEIKKVGSQLRYWERLAVAITLTKLNEAPEIKNIKMNFNNSS